MEPFPWLSPSIQEGFGGLSELPAFVSWTFKDYKLLLIDLKQLRYTVGSL